MARYALVIGIPEYKTPLARLPKTTSDAEEVAQLLEKHGNFQNVTRLPQLWNQEKNCYEMAAKGVTKAQLDEALKTFLLGLPRNSEALLYFTGHGITVFDKPIEPSGYLATSDCVLERQGKQIIEQRYGYSLEGLNELIGASDSSSLIVVLDCCHSGHLLERQLVVRSFNAFNSRRDYYLITACRGSELAYVGEDHSVFTGALLRGLSQENAGKDGQIGVDRLFEFISKELRLSGQEPLRMGLGGFIPLVTYSIQNTAPTPATFTRQNPYLGLKSFELEQAEYFGGREKAILELTARLTNSRFLTVIGASGCGKSSLVKAGLFPQLMRDRIPGSSQWATQSITPGEDALERLVETLSQLHGQNKPFVLFIDQFEEIFTLCKNDEQRTSFFHLMAEEEKNLQHQGRLIVAVRGDFLDRCAEYPEIAQLINRTQPTTYMVEPLSREELQEAITKPAQLHSVTFEPGLVSQMAEDVARQPGALPLLQYALRELWRVCIEESEIPQSCLTWQGYEKIGRVTGALETQANLTYESFISEADKDFVRKLFLELVELSNDGETVTRRRVTKSSLEAIADSLEQLDRVVGKLAKLRLIVVTTEKKGEGEFQTYAEVTHEALLSKWELLKGWIAENRENIRLERRFEADFQEWKQRHQKSEDALLTGARLTDIADWMQKTQPRLSTEEQEYIQRSLARRDRQLKAEIQRIELQLEQERKLRELSASRQKEAEQKTRIAITSLCGLTLLATSTLGYWIQAEQHKNRAIQALISEPIQLFKINNQLEAMIASVKALEELRKVGGGTEHAVNKLKTSVIDKSRESNRLQDHQGAVLGVSFSPDGKTIASASGDQTIKLWSLGGEVKETLSGHTKGVWNVIFSPMEGNMIASAGIDTTVRLWNAETGQQLKTLTGHKHPVYGMSFRPDSKVIATSSEDGTIKLWDTATGNELETLEKLPVQDNIYSVDFSRDGKTLASIGYKDGSVKLWNLETRSSRLIGRHQETGLFVKFSPNGQVLASSSNDGVIKLWNDGQPLPDIKAHEKPIYELAFSPDSETIVSASSDESIKLWKLDGTLIDTLIAKSGEVYSISASLNQEDYLLIASAGEDTSVRLWKISFNDKFDWFAEGANPQEAHRQAIAQLEQRLGINPKLDALGYQVYSRTIFDRLSNSSLSVTSIVVENNREEISRKRCPTCKPPKRCHLED